MNFKSVRYKNGEYLVEKTLEFFEEILPKLGYESREGQLEMASDICEAYRDNNHLLVEAGVGIGKSFAYLVPIMYLYQKTYTPVVVSTSTILLQEQLLQDIEFLSKILKIFPEVVLAKGMAHFKCQCRADTFLEKMSKVASVHRFHYHGTPIYSLSNDLITQVNELRYLSDFKKKSRILHYQAFQEDCRGQQYLSSSALIRVNARDLWVYHSVQEEEPYLTDMEILSGLRYFAYAYPDVFQDEEFMQHTQSFMDSCCNVPIFRRVGKQYHMALDTRRVLQKVKKNLR